MLKVKNYSENDNEIRLVKYHKKGILRFIFSRIVIFALLLFLQVGIIYYYLGKLQKYIPYYSVIMITFTIIMVLYLFNCSMDSSAKLTWMVIISIVPITGAIFFAYTRVEIGHRALKKMVSGAISDSKGIMTTEKRILKKLEDDRSGIKEISNYLNNTGCFPIFDNSQVEYYPSGEDCFPVLLERLKNAKEYIFMEFFIVEEGIMWGRILKILADKVKEGVEVRVMYDGMCEMQLLPYNYSERLKQLGIQAKSFAPIHPLISTYFNYRDHRKVVVIDGEYALNGGINLADEYINKKYRFGYWKDTAIMVTGNAVKAYTLMFLQMWSSGDHDREFEKYLRTPKSGREIKAPGFVLPYSDIPLDDDKVGENVYMDVLNRASRYVHIMTPYLILDDEMKNAIKYAAMRGVDVKLILPGIPDKKAAYALAKSHYSELINAGVKIYEFTTGFVHAKVFVSDDEKAIVGTINLDYRSLYHHFECATYMYKTDCISEIENDYQLMLRKCRIVTKDSIKKEKIIYKMVGGVVKTFAPLM